MTTAAVKVARTAGERRPLTRTRVLEAALRYVDAHGIAALSMHKLGAELGVKGMSLYNHIEGKDDLYDGIVEAMWAEVEIPSELPRDWHQAVRTLAHSLRDLTHRHPNAAPLLTARQVMPEQALRTFDVYLGVLQDAGLPEERAAEVLRTVFAYAFGFALTEVTWMCADTGGPEESELQTFRRVSAMIPGDVPEHLLRVALLVCGRCDMDAQFELGIDLMLRGLDATGADTGPRGAACRQRRGP